MAGETRSWAGLRPRRLRPHEALGPGRVAVVVPRFHRRWLLALAGRLGIAEHRVRLDAEGSLVWKLCDGGHSVEQIGRALAERFGEGVQPVEERLPRFLAQLARHEMIALEE